MLVLDALGSDLKVKYKGDEYIIKYSFLTGPQVNETVLKADDGSLDIDLHKYAKLAINKIDGCWLKIGEEEIKIDTVEKLYKYPLSELQRKIATELFGDITKKYKLTGTK